MKKFILGFTLTIAFLVAFFTFDPFLIFKKGLIESVAPYAFYDYGNFIEIKGGWNFSDTKYESTAIVGNKELGVIADYTARLINGHLHMAPILWKVKYWHGEPKYPDRQFLQEYSGCIIATSADMGGIYSDSLLYFDRTNKNVFIVKKESGNPEEDWKELIDIGNIENLPDNWEVVEELQNTFYQRYQ